jgi:hypothetical protein
MLLGVMPVPVDFRYPSLLVVAAKGYAAVNKVSKVLISFFHGSHSSFVLETAS